MSIKRYVNKYDGYCRLGFREYARVYNDESDVGFESF
jgi:hypothetical protein